MGASAPDSVKRLVDLFDREREVYQSADYKEEQLHSESVPSPSIRHSSFVIRTFPDKPVIHEESIKACPERSRRIAGATKAPDFRDFADGRRLTADGHGRGW